MFQESRSCHTQQHSEKPKEKIKDLLHSDRSVGHALIDTGVELSSVMGIHTWNLYATMTTVAGMVLREHFGFGKQRLLKFRNEFQNMIKSALDLDYLGSHYVTLEDYANELNEQFDMGIDVSRVRNCQGSYDETDAKFRTVKLDKVLEELRAGGFEDAAQFLEKKVA